MVTKSINLPKSIESQLAIFSQQVHTNDPDATIILFGSYARGNAQPTSDIDVCVITDKYGTNYHDGTVSLLEIAHKLDLPMDIIPYTPEDFANKYDPLVKEIKTYGRQIMPLS